MSSRNASVALLAVLLSLALGLLVPWTPAVANGGTDVLMKDSLAFEPDTLTAVEGATVSVHVINDGTIPHTFTLFAEVNPEVPFSPQSELETYNDTHAKVLDANGDPVDILLQAGEEATITFTAPDAPGTYIFVCMEEQHAGLGMHGVLTVTAADTGMDGDGGGISPVLIGAIVGVVVVIAGAAFFLLRRRGP